LGFAFPFNSAASTYQQSTKHPKTHSKWFHTPYDRLTVLSVVEGLNTLSQVEG
jgi:hypothetical protein